MNAAFPEGPKATSQQIKENPDVPAAPSPRQKAGAGTRKRGRSNKRADKPVGLNDSTTTSKSAAVMTMLRSSDGVTLEAMQQATGWHSVRGFLSGTVKKRMALSLASERGDDGIRRYRIASRNPKIVYCSLSGFGSEGPSSKEPGQDLLLQSLSGLLLLNGRAGDPPTPVAVAATEDRNRHEGGQQFNVCRTRSAT